jgi:hypothetical protein
MHGLRQPTCRRLLLALALLLPWAGWAQQQCHPSLPRTRPDSRYEAVAGASPAGSQVRDRVTGLVWQRCAMGMAWNGSNCTGTALEFHWSDALDAGRNVGGGWRVPNRVELTSLVEGACRHPAINTTWFPDTPQVFAWSSTAHRAIYVAWSVAFFGDQYDTHGRTIPAFTSSRLLTVRLVRDGP